MVELLNTESQSELEEFWKLRNNSNLLGIDVLAAWQERVGMVEPGGQFGEQRILKYGGLQSGYISMEDLKVLTVDKPIIIKQNSEICAGLIYTTRLTCNNSISEQEKIFFGKNTEKLLTEDLVCRNPEEEKNRGNALEALKNGSLAYGATVFVKKDIQHQRRGVEIQLKTFEYLLENKKKFFFFRIFEITGIGVCKDNGYEEVYTFNPSIVNVRNISLGKMPGSKPLGVMRMVKKVTEMVDNIVTPEKTRIEAAKMLGIPSGSVDSYSILINNLFFISDLEIIIEYMRNKKKGR